MFDSIKRLLGVAERMESTTVRLCDDLEQLDLTLRATLGELAELKEKLK